MVSRTKTQEGPFRIKNLQKLLRIHVHHQIVSGVLRQHLFHQSMQTAAVGGTGEELETPLAAETLQWRRGRAGEADTSGERMLAEVRGEAGDLLPGAVAVLVE